MLCARKIPPFKAAKSSMAYYASGQHEFPRAADLSAATLENVFCFCAAHFCSVNFKYRTLAKCDNDFFYSTTTNFHILICLFKYLIR